ncbi:class I SAM-dependent methyltransferase [Nocardioides rubriscoriae]|uniref:class I SAM-dependent methyltransferase n=1 Tax=Nocardioides rubriscoriae TaxID=642762 RepID=UPI0011E056A0|nr:SAM-dependent methyltransferase [Nocardioides rubriscoriae]
MSDSLDRALALVRDALLDADGLVRAVASGRRRAAAPSWRRVEARWVDLKAGRHLQLTSYDATQAHTGNHAIGPEAARAVDALLAEPFGSWHVETATHTHQVRVSKRDEAFVSSKARAEPVEVEHRHDRTKDRRLADDDPVWQALGLADAHGRVKPSRQAKYRQVEEFLRLLDTVVTEAQAAGHLRHPTVDDPLRVVDLGCGNAYLTIAAQRFLVEVRGLPVTVTGVDVREQSRQRNADVAAGLGLDASFVAGTIAEAVVEPAPEVVLALHACDTATDDALARAVAWRSPVVLAAPCCHHDVATQLRRGPTPAAYAELVRHGILRERLADTLTDGLRSSLMRLQGYRVDVVQFVESKHTPRNTMLRAVRTGVVPDGVRDDYDALVGEWHLRPALAGLLGVSGS